MLSVQRAREALASVEATKNAMIPPIKSRQFFTRDQFPTAINTLKDYGTYVFNSAIKSILKTNRAYCNCVGF